MGLIAKDLPTLVLMLLPGLVAAGVFYTLTAHPKSSEFERLIQALIFTAILKLLSILIKGAALGLGNLVVLGEWTSDVELAYSIALALPLGLSFALFANKDTFHKVLRRRSVTTRTSYPSEWYSAFARGSRWLILHLKDRRRLYGWPR